MQVTVTTHQAKHANKIARKHIDLLHSDDFWNAITCAWCLCRARLRSAWLNKITSGRHIAHKILIQTNIPRTSDVFTCTILTAGAVFKKTNGWQLEHC